MAGMFEVERVNVRGLRRRQDRDAGRTFSVFRSLRADPI